MRGNPVHKYLEIGPPLFRPKLRHWWTF